MLIGYVSDEQDLAVYDAVLTFGGPSGVVTVRSNAAGAVYADLTPGRYRTVLARDGYGGKAVELDVAEGQPYCFRLLRDGLLGYAWPKWVQGHLTG